MSESITKEVFFYPISEFPKLRMKASTDFLFMAKDGSVCGRTVYVGSISFIKKYKSFAYMPGQSQETVFKIPVVLTPEQILAKQEKEKKEKEILDKAIALIKEYNQANITVKRKGKELLASISDDVLETYLYSYWNPVFGNATKMSYPSYKNFLDYKEEEHDYDGDDDDELG
jgi:hypothetical protein